MMMAHVLSRAGIAGDAPGLVGADIVTANAKGNDTGFCNRKLIGATASLTGMASKGDPGAQGG
jgi:hypothetical protein